MPDVGGDLETLRQLHKGLGELSQSAADMRTKGDQHLHSTVWRGHNADRFRSAWEDFKPAFTKMQTALQDGQNDVRTQHNDLAAATGESASL